MQRAIEAGMLSLEPGAPAIQALPSQRCLMPLRDTRLGDSDSDERIWCKVHPGRLVVGCRSWIRHGSRKDGRCQASGAPAARRGAGGRPGAVMCLLAPGARVRL